jgi:hypothetical protein
MLLGSIGISQILLLVGVKNLPHLIRIGWLVFFLANYSLKAWQKKLTHLGINLSVWVG